ncbi:hypothetical protein E2562_036167 [Oryza meyeriana var. granulata]|uniref:Uncharacterized protein n=1 Tax=Oryza meyeriana var. granulata TaxID=110450 RepID=A0A6G1CX81_9ORYZ|nr:hypothetical protein E2562_036167 [Oryza meyeriana var. granulata]
MVAVVLRVHSAAEERVRTLAAFIWSTTALVVLRPCQAPEEELRCGKLQLRTGLGVEQSAVDKLPPSSQRDQGAVVAAGRGMRNGRSTLAPPRRRLLPLLLQQLPKLICRHRTRGLKACMLPF